MKIARVFPRRTNATPIDELSFFTEPMAGVLMPEFDEVHVSVTFTYDMETAEWLYHQWERVGVPVKIGGPAFKQKSGEFIPGRYLKTGYTITSRGCYNNCWFCSVPKREGHTLTELEIKDGWIIADDNLLACSKKHIQEVFEMLKRQPNPAEFTGGLEAKLLKPWHADLLKSIKPKQLYFAYDTPDDLEPLIEAGKTLRNAGFKKSDHNIGCYVLIGYPKDTFEKADKRCLEAISAGFMPFAMLYKDEQGNENEEWRQFQRTWANARIVGKKIGEINGTASNKPTTRKEYDQIVLAL